MSKKQPFFENAGASMNEFFESAGKNFQKAGENLKRFGNWLVNDHRAAFLAVVIGLVIFAAVAAAIFFSGGTAAIPFLAGLSLTLPSIGTVAPLAFLSSLSLLGASLTIGAIAGGAFTFVVSPVINLFAYIYNKIIPSSTTNNGNSEDQSNSNDDNDLSDDDDVEDFGQDSARLMGQHLHGNGSSSSHTQRRDEGEPQFTQLHQNAHQQHVDDEQPQRGRGFGFGGDQDE